jgi:small conductance mechanosensitive channel
MEEDSVVVEVQDTAQVHTMSTMETIVDVVQDPIQLLSVDLWKAGMDYLLTFGVNLLISAGILIIGFWLAKRIKRTLGIVLEKRDIDPSVRTFIQDFVTVVFKILVAITALAKLGIEMTSFLALLGAAGFAIGMAFSGALGNFAGGILLLVLRPYRVDDVVIAKGELGKVLDIQLFNTVMLTFDNKTIIIPNGEIIKDSITNFTKQDIRRVDFDFGLSYGHDYPAAKEIILEICKRHEMILKEPEPFVGLKNLGDSSVDLTCRVWTATENYWTVYYYLSETIYKELPERGFPFPFPQLDVHLGKEGE